MSKTIVTAFAGANYFCELCMPEKTDTYYVDQSKKYIEAAIEESAGKTLEEIRFAIRRAYPFGPLRQGRPYKIWNKLVLQKEAELGLEPRRHKKKND